MKKVILKCIPVLGIVLLMSSFTSKKESNSEEKKSTVSHYYTGQQLFAQYVLSINKTMDQKSKNDINEALLLRNPSFFNDFKNLLESQNPVLIEKALKESKIELNEVLNVDNRFSAVKYNWGSYYKTSVYVYEGWVALYEGEKLKSNVYYSDRELVQKIMDDIQINQIY